jgi:TolA-binding protein
MKNDALMRLADLYFKSKDYNKAQVLYQDLIDRRAKSYDYALLQKANIEGILKNHDAKINSLTMLLANFPKTIYVEEANYQLGLAYEAAGKNEQALKSYSDIILRFSNSNIAPKALMRKAVLAFNLGKNEEAIKSYTDIINFYPNSVQANQALNSIKEIFIQEGKPEAYINYVSKLPNASRFEIESQDTLLYESAMQFYANGNCEKSSIYLRKYLEKYPEGGFSYNAHYYLAECYIVKNQIDFALPHYEKVAESPNSNFYEKSLVKAGYYNYYNKKDYNKAAKYYNKLNEVATTKQNNLIAKLGMLETHFKLKKYDVVLESSKLILDDPNINAENKNTALYYQAKSYYESKNYDLAYSLFEKMSYNMNSERGAEASYYLADILNKRNLYDHSNKSLLKAKDEFSSYEYWYVRYFLLMADNYYKLNELIQSKATLQSIINYYDGNNKDLIAQAKKQLAMVENELKSKSKVKQTKTQ